MTLIDLLKTVPDPRSPRGQRHPLWLVLFLALWGSLCGYWGYRPLERFCQKHHRTCCQLLALEPSSTLMPSYSTFRRIFQLVDAQGWVKAFNIWALRKAPELAGRLWSVDGKSIKCTLVGGNSREQDFVSLVSVYGQCAGVLQLELMSNAQESEIEVAKRLVERLTRTPALMPSRSVGWSLDALHLQVGTLELLASRQCHYQVTLKANQKQLYQQAQRWVQQQPPLSAVTHWETLHGRQTQRTVRVYPLPPQLPLRWSHTGMARLIWVQRQGTRSGRPFAQEHFYLSNWLLDAAEFLELIRAHWQIENGLHWVKDVTLQEDYPPRRGGYAPISWAIFNSFLITLARRLGCRTVPDCQRELANQVHQVFRWLT